MTKYDCTNLDDDDYDYDDDDAMGFLFVFLREIRFCTQMLVIGWYACLSWIIGRFQIKLGLEW